MLRLLQAGAVPFGYTTDMSDSDLPYHRGDCISALEIHWRHHHYLDADGFRLLPDVIISNTPPPSPLRRSQSCLAVFHDKTQTQTSLTLPASSNIPEGSDVEVEARLSHIHEVRRQVQSDASSTHHLPRLSWVLPRPQGDRGEEEIRRGREDDEAGERRRVWRHVGEDLRKMADQFRVKRSSRSAKVSAELAVPASSLPAILSRCLAGSLLCLVWWRLYHGSR